MSRETLGQKQRRFTKLVGQLIAYAYANGYELTFGRAYDEPESTVGIPNSLHKIRLAIDLNLFANGVWLKTTEAHRPLGLYWESLAPDCTWGGRFKKPDGNHYSITHQGVR